MASLFGYELKKRQVKEEPSVVSPENTDGSVVFDGAIAGYYSASLDLEGQIKNESELIRRYRNTAMYSDVDSAIDEIVNEILINEEGKDLVELNLDNIKLSDSIKNIFNEEFKNILGLLNFNNNGYDLVRDWYIDGRLAHYVILNQDTKQGIKEFRYIDPRKIKKIKNVIKSKTSQGVDVVTKTEEYYAYNDKGITDTSNSVKISSDSIIYTPSGNIDKNTGMILSYLHKAIKPVNQLKYIEDALVIYRISRAPERRIFYIDVGNLPKQKAEQYVNDLMTKYRNKIVYDANTGEVKDDRKHLSMMEDFWMPRREGGKGTEITTLQGGQNLGNIEDIEYFQKKLFQALNVPLSRLQQNGGMFDIGRSSAISRDEVKFSKFIDRLRLKFSSLFIDAMRIQLISKGIVDSETWDSIKNNIKIVYQNDNMYSEIKDADILNQRLQSLTMIDQFVGKYVDEIWVRKNILKQSDDDIKEIDKRNNELKQQRLAFATHQGELDQARNPGE